MEYIYAALLLHKVGKDVTADNIASVVKATGVDVDESKCKVLAASLEGVDIADKLANASVMAAPAAGSAPAAAEAPKEEEKKEEPKAEAAEGLASLFG